MYYLQSRYYDASVGRFINIDTTSALSLDGILEKDLFCYCYNSPTINSDQNGCWVHLAVGAAVSVIINIVIYLLFCKFDPNTKFSTVGFLGLILTSAAGGAFAAGTGKIVSQVLFSVGMSVASAITDMYGQYIRYKTKYTTEDILIEIIAAIISGTIAGFVGGAGPGANFKTYSKNLLKKFLTYNLSTILKGLAYYISQVGKLLLKSVVWRSVIRPFIYNILSNKLSKSTYNFAKKLIGG